jgi:hypothetical protein
MFDALIVSDEQTFRKNLVSTSQNLCSPDYLSDVNEHSAIKIYSRLASALWTM